MGWSKDASQSPVITYTPSQDLNLAPIEKIVYDPNAAQKWTIHLGYVIQPGTTIEQLESHLGVV